ncbi:MAG: AMP-binding protein [Flaviflexus sp.]|nr:AMP-binding protein [Flaviflexus sp.]
MDVCSSPSLVEITSGVVTDLLEDRYQLAPHFPAFTRPHQGGWTEVSTADFRSQVRALARGLVAAGVEPGDYVIIWAPTCYEWAVAELATGYAGAVVIPLYDTASQAQAADIIGRCPPRLALVAGRERATTLTELGVPHVELSDSGFAELAAAGEAVSEEEIEHRRTSPDLDDPATIVFTSGTTGGPKGALITHRNLLHQVRNIRAAYSQIVREGGSTIILLPLAHVLARGLQQVCLGNGLTIAHIADPAAAVASLGELRPTFLVVVPRIMEKILAAIEATASEKHLGAVWRFAFAAGVARGRAKLGEQTEPRFSRLLFPLLDRLFFAKIRAKLGGRMEYMLSGAAPLDADTCRFFLGIGLPVVEGYGLTETTAPITGNLPGHIKPGTVGRPVPGATVKIEDGEVLVAGAGVVPGYENDRDTEAGFSNGFFRTGDLGCLDEDGYLTLTGRCKDLIVTSGGKTIIPAAWEQAVEAAPGIDHAIVVGDGQAHPAALIFLEEAGHSLREVRGEARALAARAVTAANRLVSQAEEVRRFLVLAGDLSNFLTPTQKIRRSRLIARLEPRIDDLYRAERHRLR